MTKLPSDWPAAVAEVLESLPERLADAFVAYEQALQDDDVEALSRAFRDYSGDTLALRTDAHGLLAGAGEIEAFRRLRGGIGPRRVVELYARALNDEAFTLVSVNEPSKGGRGVNTQVWVLNDGEWNIDVAHVLAPAPAIDRSVWRVVGSPLVAGTTGTLSGCTVAVKDLFAIAGQRIGAGNPKYLADAPVETAHAAAVQKLLDAGASVTGIVQTDEFAYSIAGRNVHYGTPPNIAAPGRIPGGSSSGPAAAVSLGQADIGLGTDTGGSVRVPASYHGLWGIRTTHGAVDRSGLLPLAPSFDTVGWLTHTPTLLHQAAAASLDPEAGVAPALGQQFVVVDDLIALLEDDVALAFNDTIQALMDRGLDVAHVTAPWITGVFEAFRVVQAAQAWRSDGAWFSAHADDVAPDVANRFQIAAGIDATTESEGLVERANMIAKIDRLLGDAVLLLPSASSAAPRLDASAEEIDRIRTNTLMLTAIAGVTGRPAVSAPMMSVSDPVSHVRNLPVGLCFVGHRRSDLALIELAARTAEKLSTEP